MTVCSILRCKYNNEKNNECLNKSLIKDLTLRGATTIRKYYMPSYFIQIFTLHSLNRKEISMKNSFTIHCPLFKKIKVLYKLHNI